MDLFQEPVIGSMLDTDTYKLSMQQAVFHQYPKARVKYRFTCRNQNQKLGYLAEIVKRQVKMMAGLKLTDEEKDYLKTIRFLKPDYIDALAKFCFKPESVMVSNQNGDLEIEISGYMFDEILWEVPLLAIISESHFRSDPEYNPEKSFAVGREKLVQKIELINQYHLPIVDMGTRRRFSAKWQEEVVRTLSQHCCVDDFRGTSNVYLAMKYGLKPIGTQAHEWFMLHLGLVDNIRQAQKRALHVWQQEYDDDLGIALTDTFTTKAFFEDFDKTLTRSFDGVRHDSADPFTFGFNAIDHYRKMGIDPLSKTIVFSDNLKVLKTVLPIYLEFVRKIKVSFGVGTDLTNDLDKDPLNIVIKMTESMGKNVVKLSDSPGKVMGDPKVVMAIKQAYNLI